MRELILVLVTAIATSVAREVGSDLWRCFKRRALCAGAAVSLAAAGTAAIYCWLLVSRPGPVALDQLQAVLVTAVGTSLLLLLTGILIALAMRRAASTPPHAPAAAVDVRTQPSPVSR